MCNLPCALQNWYEFSFTKISNFPNAAFLRYFVSKKLYKSHLFFSVLFLHSLDTLLSFKNFLPFIQLLNFGRNEESDDGLAHLVLTSFAIIESF